MTTGDGDRSTWFARWWVRRYTAGLPNLESTSRRAEIDSDLTEHHQCRALDGWTPKQIARERNRRLVRGMCADLSWRHDLVAGRSQVHGVLSVSVLSVVSAAGVGLAMFHFVFAAYILGYTSLATAFADQGLLPDFDGYAEEGAIFAILIALLGVVVFVASLARPISPVMANIATIPIALVAVMWFWLGVWPLGIVAVLGSVFDLSTRTPTQSHP